MTSIATRADFTAIRYGQVWEDADVLLAALGNQKGKTLLSVCSAGDNALAMLLLDPARVVAADLSLAQLRCLKLRIAMMTTLSHSEFLELMGARTSTRKDELLTTALKAVSHDDKAFWEAHRPLIVKYGVGGSGKFERYFRLFQTFGLPLVHSKRVRRDIFTPKSQKDRQSFYHTQFNTWRWRMLVRGFFSQTLMGALGRDKAFFDHVEGSVSEHVLTRVEHAGCVTNPATNPYLHWVITSTHGDALPCAWREENWSLIQSRLDRLSLHHGALETADVENVGGFNLSDVFEYMSPQDMETSYQSLIDMSAPGARLIYWNMMAPRRRPERFKDTVRTLHDLENDLKDKDNAFFYKDFVIEEVV